MIKSVSKTRIQLFSLTLLKEHIVTTIILNIKSYLSFANLELEGLTTVTGAVNLLAIGQGQNIMTGHSLAVPRKFLLLTLKSVV